MSSDLVQQLMLIDETELQQQAMDLVVLFLREGCVIMYCLDH